MSRARLTVVAALAASLALIACAACTTGTSPPPEAPSVRATITVGKGPCAVVEAFGKVWVTLLSSSELVAIDPATNAVVGRYSMAGLQPCGITATATALWVGGGASSVVEVEPSSGAIKRTVVMPGPVWDLQAGAGALWVSLGERGQLVRIDPTSGTAGAPFEIGSRGSGGAGRIGGLAVAADGVYVADTDGRRIVHVAPTGTALLSTWPLQYRPAWLALEGDSLWISSTDDHVLVAVDTSSGAVGAPVPAGEKPQDPGAGAGVAYVADEASGRLTWATAAGAHGSVPLSGTGYWVSEVLASGLWVLDFDGTTVVRLNPSPAASPSASPSAARSTPAASARADLDKLLERLETLHPKPFHGIPRSEWVSRLEKVKADLPSRTPQQALVDVMGLVAALSHAGRDGHQIVIPLGTDPMLPVQVFEFTDGLFITNARDSSLVGARILAVDGTPIDTVLSRLEPLVPRDSPASVPLFRPFFFLRADVLLGLGVTTASDRVTLTVERAGTQRDVDLTPIPAAEFTTWAGPLGVIHLPARDGLRYTDKSELLQVERIGTSVYARLNEVHWPSADDLARLKAQLAKPGVQRVIFDLRQNSGGDNRTYWELVDVLRTVTVPLWVLTDRATFSAASNLATELEALSTVRFAGEPMGGGLNFWDEVEFIKLEHLPIPVQVGLSTEYFERSTPEDPRLTIEPDLPVGYTSADYFAGRDVLLDRLGTGSED